MGTKQSNLLDIPTSNIKPNPENPRLIFREIELQGLLESIREVGIKVPIAVYEDRGKYVLLDGERRWRCTLKLNLKTIPALVQPKPSRLENLLMMFNIHNVRVQWDLLPTAMKLRDIKTMLEEDGKSTDFRHLAGITGLTVTTVKRAFELLDLPSKYQRMLLQEAEKPRAEQKITADLFIEINKAMTAVEKYTPEVLEKVPKAKFVDSMFHKYVTGIENNVVGFRRISKIARAEKTGVPRSSVVPTLVDLAIKPEYSIEQAYIDTVSAAYEARDLSTKALTIAESLSKYQSARSFPETLKVNLSQLREQIDRLLGIRR
jgi:ParB family transcriptional regulator, chromosome partitioning protein